MQKHSATGCASSRRESTLDTTLESNDRYRISFVARNRVVLAFSLGPEEGGGGMRRYRRRLGRTLTGIDYVAIEPMEGDAFYSIGHVRLGLGGSRMSVTPPPGSPSALAANSTPPRPGEPKKEPSGPKR